MQYISENISAVRQGRGGRISSTRLRESIDQSQSFTGLEQKVDRYDLLLVVKRVGKSAGFTSKMIQLLDYYMAFTREVDWEEGNRPIVYQSIYKTALDLGVSDRQIQKLERQLFDVGALTWNDSGNCKRYGQRCAKTGRILYAFGVDLTPLAYQKAALEEKLQEKQLYDAARMETKRQVSWHRSQIKAILAEMEELNVTEQGRFTTDKYNKLYDSIAIRYTASMGLEQLRSLLARHKDVYEQLLSQLQTTNKDQKDKESSPKTDSLVMHKQITNQKPFNKLNTRRDHSHCFRGRGNGDIEGNDQTLKSGEEVSEVGQGATEESLILKTGLQHIRPKQALNSASPRFIAYMPMEQRELNWDDLVHAAYKMRPDLHISQESWGRACHTLTRYGAAICILLTDQATQRPENPVKKPAAYFNTMIARAKAGELHLHKSIFGLLKRDTPSEASNSNEIDKLTERN